MVASVLQTLAFQVWPLSYCFQLKFYGDSQTERVYFREEDTYLLKRAGPSSLFLFFNFWLPRGFVLVGAQHRPLGRNRGDGADQAEGGLLVRSQGRTSLLFLLAARRRGLRGPQLPRATTTSLRNSRRPSSTFHRKMTETCQT